MTDCKHVGCSRHITHPCEECGRIGGRYVSCPICGAEVLGDGIRTPVHCEFAEVPQDAEPDSGPYWCGVSDDYLEE